VVESPYHIPSNDSNRSSTMPAIKTFKQALVDLHIEPSLVAQIMHGYEKISDSSSKELRAAFFRRAMELVDQQLEVETRRDLRDACACSKSGWRLKAVQKVAKEYAGRTLEEKIAALNQVTHMGKPVLHPDGTIIAGIGDQGGFPCPCPVFGELKNPEPVSKTYCYCCAGHFRFHYQIALGIRLVTKTVISSALASRSQETCRFVYEIIGD
jgi:hypothetical protein